LDKRDRAKRLKRFIKTIEVECEELQVRVHEFENPTVVQGTASSSRVNNRMVSPTPPKDTNTSGNSPRDLQNAFDDICADDSGEEEAPTND
jgi:hypothetical protein